MKDLLKGFCLDLAFDLLNARKKHKLPVECTLNNGTAQWIYNWNNEFNGTQIPECLHVCDQSPPNPSENQTRQWTKGRHVIGKMANYTCDNEDQYFRTRFVYNQITMICSLNLTSNSGEWIWMDEGNKTHEIPECQVRHN